MTNATPQPRPRVCRPTCQRRSSIGKAYRFFGDRVPGIMADMERALTA